MHMFTHMSVHMSAHTSISMSSVFQAAQMCRSHRNTRWHAASNAVIETFIGTFHRNLPSELPVGTFHRNYPSEPSIGTIRRNFPSELSVGTFSPESFIHRCLGHMNGVVMCGEGYSGMLCAECEAGYYTAGFSCFKCSDHSVRDSASASPTPMPGLVTRSLLDHN